MRTLVVLVMAPLLMATSCLRPVKIGVAPSPAHKPTFEFSHFDVPLKRLGEFAVLQCRPETLRRPVWRVARSRTLADGPLTWAEREARDSSEALRITYGETPEGFLEIVAPEPLVPGRCYLAEVRDDYPGGYREFRLLPDGRVEMGTPSSYYDRGDGELNRAAVHCKRSYQRASRADSLRIDTWSHAVADTSVTCAELRTGHPYVMRTAQDRETRGLAGILLAVGVAALIASGLDGEK